MKKVLFLFLLIPFLLKGQGVFLLAPTKASPIPVQTMYDEDTPLGSGANQNNYVGTGWMTADNSQHYAGTLHYSKTTNDYVTFTTYGYRIQVIAPKYLNQGKAAISIDGGTEKIVDQYDATGIAYVANPAGAIQLDTTLATNGEHTVKVRVTGTKNASSSDYYVFIDGWNVYSNQLTPIAPTPGPNDGYYYVDQVNGSDGSPGSSAQPFKTGQKCASVAQPGDRCIFRSGTYRETITPASSGTALAHIIFEKELGATVTISGLELVGDAGWTAHDISGGKSIYKKTITLPTTGYRTAPAGIFSTQNLASADIANDYIFANQIVKNGSMIIEASWPKGIKDQDDYFEMVANNNMSTSQWIHVSQTGSNDLGPTGVTDTHIGANFTSGSLVGAKLISQGWYVSNSGTVTAHSGNRINISVDNNRYGGPGAFWKFYRLTNQLQFLTQVNEWYYGGGVLYAWQPGGGSPTGLEYKARNWGFNLRDKDYIDIRGISFIGCEAATGNAFTDNNTIDNVRSTLANHNLTHSVFLEQGHGMAQFMGTKMGGTGNTVKNSEFSYTASMCLWMGSNGVVDNNKFDYIGYDGMWGAPLSLWGLDNIDNVKFTNNTATHLGRGAFDNGFANGMNSAKHADGWMKNTTNMVMAYNDISYFSMRVHDGGAWYSSGWQNIAGDVFHHNVIHDMPSFQNPNHDASTARTDGLMAGLYFDQASGAAAGQTPVKVYNNIFYRIGVNPPISPWNPVEVCDIYELPYYCGGSSNEWGTTSCDSRLNNAKQPMKIWNNTMASGTPGSNAVKGHVTAQGTYLPEMKNNISYGEDSQNGVSVPSYFTFGLYRTLAGFTGGTINVTPVSTYFSLASTGSAAYGGGTSVESNAGEALPYDRGAIPYNTTFPNYGYNATTFVPTP